mgnify:FL=1
MAYISAVVIAAGESSRMGCFKPLLEWNGLPMIEFQISSLFEAGVTEVVVVVGHNYESIIEKILALGAGYVINEYYLDGKTTSIKAGIASISPDCEEILLLAVDQPRPPDIISNIIDSHLENDALITSPVYQDRGGHPIMFSSSLKPDLESITESSQGIREIFQSNSDAINRIKIDNPIIRLDLNNFETYQSAKLRYNA